MPDIKCSQFTPKQWRHPAARIAIWSATLTPAPAGEWRTIFGQELTIEGKLGNSGASNHRIEGGVIEFDSPENGVDASATVIHRVVEKTNRRVEQLEDEKRRQREAQTQEDAKAAEDLKRLQQKYRGG